MRGIQFSIVAGGGLISGGVQGEVLITRFMVSCPLLSVLELEDGPDELVSGG